jgi:hypothetical protein
LHWFRVASHLKIPVQELKERITFSEFEEWCQYLDIENTVHSKLDWYLAQIAAEVRRTISKDPKQIKASDLLLKFERKEATSSIPTATKKDGWKVSKAAWMTGLGIKKPSARKKK